jgi:putative mRNA 3-end processing factor
VAHHDLIQLTANGLYCPAGDFHIDPWQPVPRAVITHGHGDHARSGMGEYHAADAGLGVLRWRLGAQAPLQGHAYGEPFALGDARLSLHPAGHVLGSAQLRVEVGGEVWVASGDYKRDPDPTCAPFEPVGCDTFISEATFALPIYRWQPTPQVVQGVIDWWNDCRARGATAVLFCYALGKAQRIAAELARLIPLDAHEERTLLLHGAMLPGFAVYREAGVAMLPTAPVMEVARKADFAGRLVLAPPSAGGSTWMRRFPKPSTAFASGWMRVRGNRRRRGDDRGFVISDHADWPGLLATIADSGARRVLATHGNTEALVRHLCEQGMDAATLRAPYGDEH